MSTKGEDVYWKVHLALPASGHSLFHCNLTVSCFLLPNCDDICGYHEYPRRCFLSPVILDSFLTLSLLWFPHFHLECWRHSLTLHSKDKTQKGKGEQKRNLKKRSWIPTLASAVVSVFLLSLLISKSFSSSHKITLGFYSTKASTSEANKNHF